MSAVSASTPSAYQVVRRDINNRASFAIAGTYTFVGACHIEADWNNKGFSRIASVAGGTAQSFAGTLANQQASALDSQGVLTLRIEEDHSTATTINFVGIGDVFGTGGQSNMDGQGVNNQVYTHPFLKAGLYSRGGSWTELLDPTTPTAGSFLPLLATQIMARTGFPVAFIPMSVAGTGISQWLPTDPGNLYNVDIQARGLAAGPLTAFLWQQGESNVLATPQTSEAVYEADLNTIVNSVWSDFGCKTVICLLQQLAADGSLVRTAQQAVIASNTHAVLGPDLSDQNIGLHFTTNGQLQLEADRWLPALVNAGLLPIAPLFVVNRAAH